MCYFFSRALSIPIPSTGIWAGRRTKDAGRRTPEAGPSRRPSLGKGPDDGAVLVRVGHWHRKADMRGELPRIGGWVRQRGAAHVVLGRARLPLRGSERPVARDELHRAEDEPPAHRLKDHRAVMLRAG